MGVSRGSHGTCDCHVEVRGQFEKSTFFSYHVDSGGLTKVVQHASK